MIVCLQAVSYTSEIFRSPLKAMTYESTSARSVTDFVMCVLAKTMTPLLCQSQYGKVEDATVIMDREDPGRFC